MSNQTKFKLKSFESDANDPFQTDANEKSVYICAHNNGETTYDFEIELTKINGKFKAEAYIGNPEANNRLAALNKLSEWMKRASETIDKAIDEGDF
jgi:hypothetical protein